MSIDRIIELEDEIDRLQAVIDRLASTELLSEPLSFLSVWDERAQVELKTRIDYAKQHAKAIRL